MVIAIGPDQSSPVCQGTLRIATGQIREWTTSPLGMVLTALRSSISDFYTKDRYPVSYHHASRAG